MKISYSWLQEFVSTTTPPEKLGEKFRMTSSEMEGIEHYGTYDHIYTGLITKVSKHPNAERLQVTDVLIGKNHYTIVTNATNVRENGVCIIALEGARVHVGIETILIKPTEIRGVRSDGMFCSLASLGLPVIESEGVWISDDRYIQQGILVEEALDLNDSVLNLEITPNRPDLLSYVGLAREVCAFEHRTPVLPHLDALPTDSSHASSIRVTIDDPKMCSRYTAVRVEGNLTSPSPWWMQRRLIVSGIRPISLIIDVTNYVALEMGQPLHAFDVEKGKTVEFHVRSAHKGEKITLLNESTYELTEGDIVVTDKKNLPIDLAGIMGGHGASISPGTTSALLESACFNSAHIRRTSRRLGVRSEASTRFEKGVDPENVLHALERAAQLLEQLGEVVVVGSVFDTRSRTPLSPRINVTYDGIQKILGVHISAQECKSILLRLGFKIQNMTKSGFCTIPPSWRKDVQLPEDVVEELIRIWGYDRVPNTVISGVVKPPHANPQFTMLHKIRRTLAALGGYECITPPFVSQKQIEAAGYTAKQSICLPNPLSSEHAFLTPSHLIGFMGNVSTQNNAHEELILFEIGKIFRAPFKENDTLSILLRSSAPLEEVIRNAKLLASECIPNLTWEYGDITKAKSGDTVVGSMTTISSAIMESYKIRRAKSIVFLEFDVDTLVTVNSSPKHYEPLPQFPNIERDLTLIVSENTAVTDIEHAVHTGHTPPILDNWSVTNIYRGKPLVSDQKAVTLHFTYNGKDRTLTDEEVSKEHKSLIAHCRKTLNATIND